MAKATKDESAAPMGEPRSSGLSPSYFPVGAPVCITIDKVPELIELLRKVKPSDSS